MVGMGDVCLRIDGSRVGSGMSCGDECHGDKKAHNTVTNTRLFFKNLSTRFPDKDVSTR
jgi:hypothetical protein